MADTSLRIYQLAIDRGILDGMARNFKSELSSYKPVYREQQRAAKALVDLNLGGGGFIEE